MSTTSTLVKQPIDWSLIEKSAHIFVIGTEDVKPAEQETEDAEAAQERAEKEQEAVQEASKKAFVLDSDDFVKLQKYLIAGRELPPTRLQFLAEYPKANFDVYFADAPQLYDVRKALFLMPTSS
jgi:hypothetical protein